jgi:hypothetical protein
MNKVKNPKQNCFGHLELVFGIYLRFGIWNLGFEILRGGVEKGP